MSFPSLAERLTDVGRTLRAYQGPLDSKALLAEADRFVKALDKFQRLLDAVAGDSPEARELAAQLARSFGADEKALKAFAQRYAPARAVSYAATDVSAVRIAKVAAGGVDGALMELRRRDAPSALDFSREDELSLLQQVRRLGQMDEDERNLEGKKLLREPEKIRVMAAAAKFKVGPRSSPKTLLKKLLETGVRYAENTGR